MADLTEEQKKAFRGLSDEWMTALDGSIEKWGKICVGIGIDLGRDNCPLCILDTATFLLPENECKACPVAIKSDRVGCNGTPYMQFIDDSPSTAISELDFLRELKKEILTVKNEGDPE